MKIYTKESLINELRDIRQRALEHFLTLLKKELTTYRFVSKMRPVVEGATHFHNLKVKPSWAKKMKPRLKIKQHIFY